MSFEWLAAFLAANWWAGVSALATVAAAVGIVLAIKQLRFDAWLKAQEIFVHDDFTNARGRIFRHLQQTSANWDLEDRIAGMLVCRRLDELCRLTPYFAFRKRQARNVVLDTWVVPLGRLWALLAPLVAAERDKVAWQQKWNAFEVLGREALCRLSSERSTLDAIAKRLEPEIRRVHGVPPRSSLPSGAASNQR